MGTAQAWARLVREPPRAAQQAADTARLAVALAFRKRLVETVLAAKVPLDRRDLRFREIHDKLAAALDKDGGGADVADFSERRVQELATEQVRTRLLREPGGNASPDEDETVYALRVGPSSVQHAGRGVHVDGHVLPGSVIAFYPGIVYAPNDWRSLPNYPHVDRDNPYLITRYDDFLIDAKGYTDRPPAAPGAVTRRLDLGGVADMAKVPEHPAGVGHLVNHPPAGVPPNVMPLSYDVPEALGALAARVPNRFLRPPSAMFARESVLLRTIVLVTTQHVTDSELFLDYRLNPNAPHLPPWYHHVNEDEARRLWAR